MPMTIGSSFGTTSAYQQLQVERARNASARQQAASDLSALTDAFSGASQSLTEGLANLAAQAALTRIQDETSAKQAETQADDTSSTNDTAPEAIDPATEVDAAINGITELLPANVSTSDDTSDGGVDVVTSVTQIIDGTDSLLASSSETDSEGNGTSLFATLDSIINSFVPPLPPAVDVVA